jgi:transcriptional regulator with XRE-family HTH domain
MDISIYKQIMKQKKMTYEDLANKTGISLGAIKRIMAGIAKYPRVDTIEAIESALGLNNDAPLPQDIMRLIDAISTLTDEECEEVSRFIDYVLSKREK